MKMITVKNVKKGIYGGHRDKRPIKCREKSPGFQIGHQHTSQ